MLEELRLTSVGGIKAASLTFGAGLTVLTGESGAGKSSLVRGLEMLCGKRASAATIHAGDDSAAAEAFFGVDEPFAGLNDELQPQDGSFSLRREISRSGRGKCAIQGKTVPLNTLSEIAPKLMTIQSQFAQLELLKPERQTEILDACGGAPLAAVKERLSAAFYQVIDNERELRQARQHESEITGKYGAVTKVAPYLQRLQLADDSEAKLNADYETAQSELTRLKDLRGRCRMLSDGERGGAVEDISAILSGILESVSGETREELSESVHTLLAGLETLADKLADLAPKERIDDLEDELERLETTIGTIRKCKRLAGVQTLPELIEYWHKGEAEMDWLLRSAKLQAQLNENAAIAKKDVAREAHELHELRLAAADLLQSRVSENLNALAMADARFRLKVIETNKVRSNGAERIEFVLQRGDQEIPVAKAASGGELSRILLAIQISLPHEMLPSTIIFDEIEAGLGGRAAYLTGLKLRELADETQVILITHEASIAALANRHYLVERNGDLSTLREVSGEDRVREIARMLSGNSEEKEPLNHARSLLGFARA